MRGTPHGKRGISRLRRGSDGDNSAHDRSRGGRGRDFLDAEAIARSGASIDGENAWSPDAFGRQRDREIANLDAWATECGLWLPQSVLAGIRRGGVEHNLILIGDPVERIWKVTKGGFFGTCPSCEFDVAPGLVSDNLVLHPATPSQYLARMALMTQIFPALDSKLEGFARLAEQFAIITSQRFIPAGGATPQEIERFFKRKGYKQLLPEAWFHTGDNIALFDVGPANILHYQGNLFPIDIIPICPAGRMLRWINEMVQDSTAR